MGYKPSENWLCVIMARDKQAEDISYSKLRDRYRQWYTGKLDEPTAGWSKKKVRKGLRLMAELPPVRVQELVKLGEAKLDDDSSNVTTTEPPSFGPSTMISHDYANVSLDYLLETADALSDLINDQDPVEIIREIDLGPGPVAVVWASCAHLGGRYTNHRAFKRVLDELLEIPNLRWASLGDDIEGFIPTFRDRSAVISQTFPLALQYITLGMVLDRIGDRLVMGTTSQHGDQWMQQLCGLNPIKNAYRKHGVPFFDGMAYLKLRVGKQTYSVAVAHEFKGHSQYHSLQGHFRALHWNFPMADAIIQGDKHQYALSEHPAFQWEYQAGNRKSPYVWLVQSGTAKDGNDKYSVKWWGNGMFDWPVLVFSGKEHQIIGTRETSVIKAILEGRT